MKYKKKFFLTIVRTSRKEETVNSVINQLESIDSLQILILN